MSVDKTIEELSSTLSQLGTLVGHINTQVAGITSRFVLFAYLFYFILVVKAASELRL